MQHVTMTRADLLGHLDEIRGAVAAEDSFEGSIEYLMPGPLGLDERADFAVRASYRVGNSEGQGGVVLVGHSDEFKDTALAHRISGIRRYARCGHAGIDEGLPAWTPEQWVTAAMTKLGQASLSLHADARTPETQEIGVEQLLAVAATCMDAVEALEREPGAEEAA